MGYIYDLVCLENGRSLTIGKLINSDTTNSESISFGSRLDNTLLPDEDRYLNQLELFALIERFMIVNRGKLMAILPVEKIEDRTDEMFTQYDGDCFVPLMQEKLEVDPFLYEDHKHISEDVKLAIEKYVGHPISWDKLNQ